MEHSKKYLVLHRVEVEWPWPRGPSCLAGWKQMHQSRAQIVGEVPTEKTIERLDLGQKAIEHIYMHVDMCLGTTRCLQTPVLVLKTRGVLQTQVPCFIWIFSEARTLKNNSAELL